MLFGYCNGIMITLFVQYGVLFMTTLLAILNGKLKGCFPCYIVFIGLAPLMTYVATIIIAAERDSLLDESVQILRDIKTPESEI